MKPNRKHFIYPSDAKRFAKIKRAEGFKVAKDFKISTAHPSYDILWWKPIITQSVDWLHHRLIKENLYNTKQAQDFLATGKGEYYGETLTYFFKYTTMFAFKEVRLHKNCKRVTTSLYRTI